MGIVENNDTLDLIDVRKPDHVNKGTLPGFRNSYCEKYLTEDLTKFRSKEEIQQILNDDGVNISKQLVFSCGAGITACINEVAALLVGAKDTSIYDGSYQEYSKKGEVDFSRPDWEEVYQY